MRQLPSAPSQVKQESEAALRHRLEETELQLAAAAASLRDTEAVGNPPTSVPLPSLADAVANALTEQHTLASSPLNPQCHRGSGNEPLRREQAVQTVPVPNSPATLDPFAGGGGGR